MSLRLIPMRTLLLVLALAMAVAGCGGSVLTTAGRAEWAPTVPVELTLGIGDVLEISYFKAYSSEGSYRLEVGDAIQVQVVSSGITGPYRLQAGDEIEIIVRSGVVQGPYKILPDGKCTLPLLGSIVLRGMTVEEARNQLLSEYQGHYDDPSLDVLVTQSTSDQIVHDVTILPDGTGTLRQIGVVQLRGLTVKAVTDTLTARYSEHFSQPRVDVVITRSRERVTDFFSVLFQRPGGAVREVTINEEGTLDLPLIQPIDVLGRPLREVRNEIAAAYKDVLPELSVTTSLLSRGQRTVTVLGEVKQAGVFETAYRISALQAIAYAGGFTDRARRSQVILVRPGPTGRLTVRSLNLDSALDFDDPQLLSVAVQPYDIVYVPRTPIGNVNAFVDQYLRRMIPLDLGFGVGYTVNQ
ncbi:polysaccharide biosynthesis/export family protein [bacterium]|nr:polysaccharide biosynthesis/export family protein [bacterium]